MAAVMYRRRWARMPVWALNTHILIEDKAQKGVKAETSYPMTIQVSWRIMLSHAGSGTHTHRQAETGFRPE